MPGLKDRLVSAGYGLGWSLVCRLPERWMSGAFRLTADIAWRRQGPRVQVLEANLRRVLGPDCDGKQLRTLSRAAMRSYGRYWLEVFRLPVITTERINAETVVSGEVPTALDHLRQGRGVIFALAHLGNWEQAGAWAIGNKFGSFTTVAERLKPDAVYERFLAFRESLGMEVLPASGGDARAFAVLAQRLRQGKLICLLADRDVTGGGIEVDFFGERARMMAGCAALALRTGAALMPVTLWFEEHGWGIHVWEEIPVPGEGDPKEKVAVMMRTLARVFERGIAAHPQDWHMLQRVFTADLDPARLAAAKGSGGSTLRASTATDRRTAPGTANDEDSS